MNTYQAKKMDALHEKNNFSSNQWVSWKDALKKVSTPLTVEDMCMYQCLALTSWESR